MKISFYMPFKPLGHSNPSGDLITGTELYNFLQAQNHEIDSASTLRCRWLYLKPWRFIDVARERRKIIRSPKIVGVDLWFSYHTYYKAPDLLGPYCSERLSIPYVIFQGIYSTKRRRSLKTLPGFLLNRRALLSAHMVFTNKKNDEHNLKRLLPGEKITYISPGIIPNQFRFDLVSRRALKESWNVSDRKVVLTTAMLRPGVKTVGVRKVIDCCDELRKKGHKLLLVVIGDGLNRALLEREAKEKLSEDVLFLGKIPRLELYRYYSAADIFAFPGIQESLGMVYLEAQSSGLPVVAFRNWGAQETVLHRKTGLLSSAERPEEFCRDIEFLLTDRVKRIEMRNAAKDHIRNSHDSARNYEAVNQALINITSSWTSKPKR